MPKTEKKEAPHKKKPYTKVSASTTDLFRYFQAEDKTNLTCAKRTAHDYAMQLGLDMSLKNLILKRTKETGKPVKILDAGCGKAKAIDMLLSDPELVDAIESISGVSLHYFKRVERVMEKHGKRFTYYSGTVQSVLAKEAETSNTFDFIFDVWGAYKYSEDKLALLRQYRLALNLGGRAFVYDGSGNELRVKKENEYNVEFSEWASIKFPATFSKKRAKHGLVLQVTRSAERLVFPEYKVASSVQSSSRPRLSKSFAELKKGNAIKTSKVVVELTSAEGMQLRPRGFGGKS